MGIGSSRINDGALIETEVDEKTLNSYQKTEREFPFHSMRLQTYEARLKRFLLRDQWLNFQ